MPALSLVLRSLHVEMEWFFNFGFLVLIDWTGSVILELLRLVLVRGKVNHDTISSPEFV